MSFRRRAFLKREPLGVTVRTHRALVRAQIHDPAKLAQFNADFPDSTLPALPVKRERRPRTVADGPSEHQEQATVITWWKHVHNLYRLPVFALFAVPNGGARDAITGSRLKAEGVRPGVYDLILAKPAGQYYGLYLEMKVGYKKPSDEQVLFGEYIASVGYAASVHWSAGSAITAIEEYLG